MSAQAPLAGEARLSERVLSEHVRAEIDGWVARFPEGRQRSAVLGALMAAQHENRGYLTREQMDAVAEYLDMPPIQVYEVATFYSMFETEPVGRHCVSVCTNISCMLRGSDEIVAVSPGQAGHQAGRKAHPTARSISSSRKSAWRLAAVRR